MLFRSRRKSTAAMAASILSASTTVMERPIGLLGPTDTTQKKRPHLMPSTLRASFWVLSKSSMTFSKDMRTSTSIRDRLSHQCTFSTLSKPASMGVSSSRRRLAERAALSRSEHGTPSTSCWLTSSASKTGKPATV